MQPIAGWLWFRETKKSCSSSLPGVPEAKITLRNFMSCVICFFFSIAFFGLDATFIFGFFFSSRLGRALGGSFVRCFGGGRFGGARFGGGGLVSRRLRGWGSGLDAGGRF